MTGGSLDEVYLEWLYRQVAPIRIKNPARTYWSLLTHLYHKDFTWFVPNDDNRLMDGLDIRYEFANNYGDATREWLERPCSMFEMLLALARRLSFAGGGETRDWFWHMLANIGLRGYVDAMPGDPEIIEFILQRVNDRDYNYDGSNGGLFPLRDAHTDQRGVEIWNQMNSYLIERG